MRRSLLLIIPALLLLFVANTSLAWEPKTARGKVFAYECRQVNDQRLGFTCVFDEGQLTLVRHERFDKMAPAKREKAQYEFDRITMRYFELGGKTTTQRADFWPAGTSRVCFPVHGNPYKVSCAGSTPEK
ncbi:MAG: hypothetical protein ACYC4A_01695 [Desulfobulbia bacterium]